jgi:glucokinase
VGRVSVGVDVGGTKLLAVALDEAGAIVEEVKVPRPADGDGVVDAIVGICHGWRDGGPPLPVGLGIAGLVDRDGTLRVSANLPGFVDYPFRATLAERLGAPAAVDNDANAAAWGELQVGAARGASDAVLVTLGTGIGSGHVQGGVLQRGAFGFGGEAGHMVVDPRGPRCPCGRHGCWERFASGSGLGRLAREAAEAGSTPRVVELAGGDPELVRGEHVAAAAAEGDDAALGVVGEFAWWVALGIANLVNIQDPEVVVIGGGLAEMGDVLLDPVRARYRELVLSPDHRPEVRMAVAELGEHAGAIGAALLARSATLP